MSDVGGEIAENCGFEGKILCEVPQPCAPCDSRDTCDTTTSEQLAEIEGQATEYTAPEGWRVLAVGELLQPGDQVVQLHDGKRYPTERAGQYVCETQRYIRPIEPEPQPEPEPEPEPVPEHMQAIIAAQAETIARLQSEAHELNMEIGGLQGDLSRRQARIRDLETLHAAASQAVERADKANDKLRAQMDQFARDASVNRLQADRNDLAGKVITLREQLQQANDRLAFLETLQPIAAACHTAQTMVRDMLGYMRCLLALQHTTDRRDFCMLLESILEVFDDAECDEDDNDKADSEAKQG